MNNDRNSVLIHENQETVWNAITNDEIISKWYARVQNGIFLNSRLERRHSSY